MKVRCIDIINSEALPITYSVRCVFIEVADNSTTHNTLLFLYSVKGSLSHRWRRTSLNDVPTRGKQHHTQTQTRALAHSTVWEKLPELLMQK